MPSPKEIRTTTTTIRTQKIFKTAPDDFDTGSDSESDIVSNSYNSSSIGLGGANSPYGRSSPIKSNYSPTKSSLSSSYEVGHVDSGGDRYSSPSADLSYGMGRSTSFKANSSSNRVSNFNSPSLASAYAADRLNEIRSRLSLNSPSEFYL